MRPSQLGQRTTSIEEPRSIGEGVAGLCERLVSSCVEDDELRVG